MLTTTSFPVVASSELSALPFPMTKPPPWMCTRTGRFAPAAVPCGAQTLRYRQFSVPPVGNPGTGNCWTHSLPNEVACSVVVQGAGGCGGCQRSAPTGGAAYGMPSHWTTPPLTMPHTGPAAVVTVVPAAQGTVASAARAEAAVCAAVAGRAEAVACRMLIVPAMSTRAEPATQTARQVRTDREAILSSSKSGLDDMKAPNKHQITTNLLRRRLVVNVLARSHYIAGTNYTRVIRRGRIARTSPWSNVR